MEGLGSLLDKSKRENIIAHILLESFANQLTLPLSEAKEILDNAITYAKAD